MKLNDTLCALAILSALLCGAGVIIALLTKQTIAKNLILMSLATLALNAGFEWEQELKARALNHLYSAIIVMLLMMRYNMQ